MGYSNILNFTFYTYSILVQVFLKNSVFYTGGLSYNTVQVNMELLYYIKYCSLLCNVKYTMSII